MRVSPGGAESHVRVSFDMPDYTGDITGTGTVRLGIVKEEHVQIHDPKKCTNPLFPPFERGMKRVCCLGRYKCYYGEHKIDCTLAQHLEQLPPLRKGDQGGFTDYSTLPLSPLC